MEDIIEDIVGQIKYTDSQKSVTTSNAYSQDFTDSSSDKNQSSGKETYIIDQMDIESEKKYPLHSDESIFNLGCNGFAESEGRRKIYNIRNSCNVHVFVENTYTQTSNTGFELRNEVSIQNTVKLQNFTTQTSFVTITANNNNIQTLKESQDVRPNEGSKQNVSDGNDSFTRESESDCESNVYENFDREVNFITLKHYESKDVIGSSEYYDDTADESTDEESWNINSDFEEDSLMQNANDTTQRDYPSDIDNGTLEPVENDVSGLHQALENVPKVSTTAFPDSDICDASILTTVTEETNINNSTLDVPQVLNSSNNIQYFKDTYRAARSKFRIQSLFNNSNTINENDTNKFKLPPIDTHPSYPSCPKNKPLLCVSYQQIQFQNHKFSSHNSIKEQQNILFDRSEYGNKNPASGESPVFCIHHDTNNNAGEVQLPQITFNMLSSKNEQQNKELEMRFEEININNKIQHLKVSHKKTKSEYKKRNNSIIECSFGEPKVYEVAEKGSDALCTDIMRRLQSSTWQEIAEILSYLPKSLESFWSIMSEMRIADLLRLIVSLVESPRTQVARAACEAAAQLLKHTHFTKKPDFYEAVGVLLAKTNSYNRVVRRAANLALDELVCGLHYSHCIAAICVGGVEHKSPLVRCASSRLLIVCCALAEGGRQLLRCRPPSAAAARRHVLQAMAVLLHDKNLETRKYAERLYAILRPLPNFEAYFLTDVDAELATEHMKKYDHLLNMKSTR